MQEVMELQEAPVQTKPKFSPKKIQVAELILAELERRGESKSAFAKIMGRQRPEISKWLSGKHNFTIETLFEIEAKLNISFFQFARKEQPIHGQRVFMHVKVR